MHSPNLIFFWDFVLDLQLLGKECYDIDIALDDMLGKEFCEKVNEYLSSTGEETQGIGVIQWYFIDPRLFLFVVKLKLHVFVDYISDASFL